jgi:hypothetical protein
MTAPIDITIHALVVMIAETAKSLTELEEQRICKLAEVTVGQVAPPTPTRSGDAARLLTIGTRHRALRNDHAVLEQQTRVLFNELETGDADDHQSHHDCCEELRLQHAYVQTHLHQVRALMMELHAIR